MSSPAGAPSWSLTSLPSPWWARCSQPAGHLVRGGRMTIPLHPEVVDALNPEKVELLLAHLLRVPDLFAVGRQHLSPDLFSSVGEAAQHLTWSAALKVAKASGPDALFASPAGARQAIE